MSSNVKTPQLGTPETLSLDPNYVTGLCEGIASFTYSRNGNGINLRFSVKVQEHDRTLPFLLMRFFGAGNVYRCQTRADSDDARGGNWHYCVTKIADIGQVVKHFSLYPLVGNRSRSFEVWKQMFELKRVPRMADQKTLFGLAVNLSELSKRRPTAKPQGKSRPND